MLYCVLAMNEKKLNIIHTHTQNIFFMFYCTLATTNATLVLVHETKCAFNFFSVLFYQKHKMIDARHNFEYIFILYIYSTFILYYFKFLKTFPIMSWNIFRINFSSHHFFSPIFYFLVTGEKIYLSWHRHLSHQACNNNNTRAHQSLNVQHNIFIFQLGTRPCDAISCFWGFQIFSFRLFLFFMSVCQKLESKKNHVSQML